jgi:hypothetical protein
MRGAEKEGAAGLLKGIGKGIGGLILKPGAGRIAQFFLDPSTNIMQLSGVFRVIPSWESTKKSARCLDPVFSTT